MTNTAPFLSIVIPAYNEEGVLSDTLEEVFDFLEKKPYCTEVIVVDDGSKDATAGAVMHCAAQHSNLRLIALQENRGKGAAVKAGVCEAAGEYILFMDADHSVHISNLDVFLTQLDEGYDIAIASIAVAGAHIDDVHHVFRRWAGALAKILIRMLVLPHIHDSQRGFKLFTQTSARQIFTQVQIPRWGFDIEVLVIAQQMSFCIREIPVDWRNRKKSDIGILDYCATFAELCVIAIKKIAGLYSQSA